MKSPAQRCAGRPRGDRRRDCELRETVSDTARCLDDLSSAQRRVLTLRAGVGAGPPRSRSGVARRLRISERRVVRLERTGLRRLRSLDRVGACAPPTAPTATSADVPASTTLTAAAVGGGSRYGGAATGSGGGRDTPAATRRRRRPREPGGGAAGDGGRGTPGGGVDVPPVGGVAGAAATNRPGGLDFTLPLLLLLLAAIAVVVTRTLRREAAAPAECPDRRAAAPALGSLVSLPDARPGLERPAPADRPSRRVVGRACAAEAREGEEWAPPTAPEPDSPALARSACKTVHFAVANRDLA